MSVYLVIECKTLPQITHAHFCTHNHAILNYICNILCWIDLISSTFISSTFNVL